MSYQKEIKIEKQVCGEKMEIAFSLFLLCSDLSVWLCKSFSVSFEFGQRRKYYYYNNIKYYYNNIIIKCNNQYIIYNIFQ